MTKILATIPVESQHEQAEGIAPGAQWACQPVYPDGVAADIACSTSGLKMIPVQTWVGDRPEFRGLIFGPWLWPTPGGNVPFFC